MVCFRVRVWEPIAAKSGPAGWSLTKTYLFHAETKALALKVAKDHRRFDTYYRGALDGTIEERKVRCRTDWVC